MSKILITGGGGYVGSMLTTALVNLGHEVSVVDIMKYEKSSLNPISLYGRTKVNAEKIIKDHPNHVSFRLATVFGVSNRMRIDLLVNDFVYKAYKTNKIQ